MIGQDSWRGMTDLGKTAAAAAAAAQETAD